MTPGAWATLALSAIAAMCGLAAALGALSPARRLGKIEGKLDALSQAISDEKLINFERSHELHTQVGHVYMLIQQIWREKYGEYPPPPPPRPSGKG